MTDASATWFDAFRWLAGTTGEAEDWGGEYLVAPMPTAMARALVSHIEALAADNERLRTEKERAEAQYRIEHQIVARIWQQFGSPEYSLLNGRSIYDLIDEVKARAERAESAEAQVAGLQARLEQLENQQ